MPRPARTLEEGRTYHVYNKVGGGAMPFADEALASRFVLLLRKVVNRDGLLVYAWALLGNHYHLVVRQSAASLSRSMKTLQQEVTWSRNRSALIDGPLWRGRFRAKRVDDAKYLGQLIAYVHLNPVSAGLVDEPASYRWSGHREVLGMRTKPTVAVDDVLAVFGQRRREALRAYRSALHDVGESDWSSEAPGHLPWWRRGRPVAGRALNPVVGEAVDELGRPTSPYRARFEADDWVETVCATVGLRRAELAGRGRDPEVVRARDMVGLVGVERYGVKVKDLAECLGKSEDGVSLWVRRGARRREEDASFAVEAEMLDSALRRER
jgi:REP element-mobilizing transposase RayT